jgi:endonuclease/exonuclease/phosphatase family metal-dependent hydrolase
MSRLVPVWRIGYVRILQGILILTLMSFLYACAGLYPAFYDRPAPQEYSTSAREDSKPAQFDTPARTTSVPQEIRTITIATLNMLHGLPHFEYLEQRRELIQAEIKRLAPDVVLLQEVPVFGNRREQIGPWLAESLGYSLAYGRANGRALLGFEEGEAVLSRYPIREVQRYVLLPKPGLIENRIVLRVVIDTPLGILEVYNTHFSHRVNRDPLRLKQAADLVRFLQDTYRFRELPAVIGGDINAFPDSDPTRFLLEKGLVDVALQVDPPADGPTSWFRDITDPTDSPKARIDYLFLYPEGAERSVTIRRCFRFLDRPFYTPTGSLWASDHVGLICELIAE